MTAGKRVYTYTIARIDGDTYSVRTSGGFVHTVWYGPPECIDATPTGIKAWNCTCDHGLRGHNCRHKIAVKQWLEDEE